MSTCEMCEQNLPPVKYASGRFCNQKCAMGFSTRSKRAEINAKVRGTVLKKGEVSMAGSEVAPCPTCGKDFKTYRNRNQVFCSNKCSATNPETREAKSQRRIQDLISGKASAKAIRCLYPFAGGHLKCYSKLEYSCLEYFERKYSVIGMQRCEVVLRYEDGDIVRRYLPDFYIQTTEGDFIVECKSVMYDSSISAKWFRYREAAPLKEAALREYALAHQIQAFWYLPNTPDSNYHRIKTSELVRF